MIGLVAMTGFWAVFSQAMIRSGHEHLLQIVLASVIGAIVVGLGGAFAYCAIKDRRQSR